ncbi:hypothetical protein BpHYR1_002727, partial [Brachionus plicatilis]
DIFVESHQKFNVNISKKPLLAYFNFKKILDIFWYGLLKFGRPLSRSVRQLAAAWPARHGHWPLNGPATWPFDRPPTLEYIHKKKFSHGLKISNTIFHTFYAIIYNNRQSLSSVFICFKNMNLIIFKESSKI